MELNLLKDIVIIFTLSTVVNFLFTKIKIPTIIGYLLTGVLTGPYLLGLVSSHHQIELLAEIGVVLLMFTIGLEFSINHLLRIRKIVFVGGFMQLILTAGITMLIARLYNMDWAGALFVGFLTALSSTAVVLKLMQERSEITSNYGRTVLGILIFQDIILIPLLLFTPMLGGEVSDQSGQLLMLLGKTVFLVGLVYVGNRWLMPKLLRMVAHTKNQELFMMSIFAICLSVALLTSEMGISLAFGAFLAGLMISESEYSHNAFGQLIPFKDTFTSFFFVSIGMLLDLNFVAEHLGLVISTVLLVLLVKMIIAGGTAFVLGHTFRGTIMVGFALCQVGEFSFILAQSGMKYQLIPEYYYQLFLAVAIISMSVTPLLMMISHPVAEKLLKLPLPKTLVNGLFPLPQIEIPVLKNHVVFIGKDARALNLSVMAKYVKMPYISIIFDPGTVKKLQEKGETVIYGDATNEPILEKAHVKTADVVVVSVGNLIVAMSIVERVRNLSPHAFIIVRTKKVVDIEELYRLGANQVIPEEFETAIELFDRVLKKRLVPQREINLLLAKIRDDHYGIFREETSKSDQLFQELPNLEIMALKVREGSFVIGKSISQIRFRKVFGVTLVAILRKEELIEHPDVHTTLELFDIVYIMGRSEQIANAFELFGKNELPVEVSQEDKA
ncbi:cation:proton antiporter [Sunxiuqinia elliptica]|uniref:Kef-type potassium/proton antiporter (CPA2 family) n=1 Tax=Sunxiuqinia elliptica TaxID=655355 RepID=A0A4R6H5A5_9BACT|nr:cation:proton antiporter [Sunxiuqinia elliptica]TDO03352.1 Kef-type potassium/proton antiporter (CPA2 family) [Sunxiuqinia elliptica]TDO59549.1 Kef-type potassium/proton antiporter (CPA2 family) [Sunxiuqinia elliptica]